MSNKQNPLRCRLTWLAPMVLAALLAGCGDKPGLPKSPAAATVNGAEISVDKVKFALTRPGQPNEPQGKDAEKGMLEQLINQQLLIEQATQKKLDADPKVLQAIDAARREIIAKAYLEELGAALPKPTEQAVADFYKAHPGLFAERRIFRFNQLAIAGGAELAPRLESKLRELDTTGNKAMLMQSLVTWLQSENIKFRATSVTQSPEQIPLDALPKFHEMKDGDVMLTPAPGGFSVMQLAASQSQPMDLEKAKPMIEQFLGNRAKLEGAQNEVVRLRKAAKLDYAADYKPAAADTGKAPGSSLPAAGAEAPASAPASPVPAKP